MKDRIDAALAARDGAALAALLDEAASKAEKKAVKKAIYLAKQRGVTVPEAAPVRAPGATLSASAPLVLMGPPLRNGGRLFTLPIPHDGAIEVVELYFEEPQGIERLHSAPSTRSQYNPWAQTMCRRRAGELPQRVSVPQAMMPRKLAELRRLVRGQRFGSDVNRSLAQRLAGYEVQSDHPADVLPASGTPLSIELLATRTWGLSAFEHESPMAIFRSQADERGRIFSGDSPLRDATREWAAEWGAEKIAETLRDCAVFAHGFGDDDAAATYRQALTDPESFVAEVGYFLTY